jgi:hypothetical protein
MPTWSITPKLYNIGGFDLTPPPVLSSAAFPGEYKYVILNGLIDGNKTYKAGLCTLQQNGHVDVSGGTGSCMIQIIKVADNTVAHSAMLMIYDSWESITPKSSTDPDFTLVAPPSMTTDNGPITYSLQPLMPGDTNEVIGLSGATVSILSAGSRMIMATQGIAGPGQINVFAMQVINP